MAAYVIDVNVPVVCNGQSPQANRQCGLECIRRLRRARETGRICIDDGDEILAEYRAKLSMSGQPGAGDEFMREVHMRQHNTRFVERVPVTPARDHRRVYEEFPADPDLVDFDRNDRKYVAVALASDENPEILNAVDSDYQEAQAALRRNGVRVRELCPDCIRRRRG